MRNIGSHELGHLLEALGSKESERAWREFLEIFSPLILQVARLVESDADRAADCFLFVCERLSEKRFRRLRRFEIDGDARFDTWLRAVVRNLCVDWRRKRFGRRRLFRSVATLPLLEQEIFRCVYEEGLGLDHAYFVLNTRFPKLSRQRLSEGLDTVRRAVSSRHEWLLSTRQVYPESLDEVRPDRAPLQVATEGPDPEVQAQRQETRRLLRSAIQALAPEDRLLVRLRFAEGLTLEAIARVLDLEDPQRVHRRLEKVLGTLREKMGE